MEYGELTLGPLLNVLSRFGLLARMLVLSYRLWSWLLPDGYRLYHVGGGMIYLNIRESKMMFMRAVGLYEPDKHAAIKALLQPRSTFVDIGANKGDFTLLAATLLGENGSVIAIEPEPENIAWIGRSIRENRLENTTLHQLAIGDFNGEAKLFLGAKSGWHTLIQGQPDRDKGTIDVQVRTLDDLLHVDSDSTERPLMIKVDVEGAELSVLRGAGALLSSSTDIVLLIDIHPDMGVDSQEVCRLLEAKGFELFEEIEPFNTILDDYSSATSIIARKEKSSG